MTKNRKRLLWITVILAIIVWRVWPGVVAVNRLNLDVPDDFTLLEKVIPPTSPPKTIHTGFSHPYFEKKKLWAEILFLPRKISHGHVFHLMPADDSLGESIAGVLRKPGALTERLGNTMCGGFHADYLLSWEEKDLNWQAVVCMGCHEVIFYHEGVSMRCWITNKAADAISELEKNAQAAR